MNDEVLALITDSKSILDNLVRNYSDLEKVLNVETQIPMPLKIKSKQFLENIKSSFDYATYALYTNQPSISKLDEKTNINNLNRLQFPNKKTRKDFNKFVNQYCFDEPFISIIHEAEKIQSYNLKSGEMNWFKMLNKLTNTNKHRYLSMQTGKVFIRGKSLTLNYNGQNVMMSDGFKIQWPGVAISDQSGSLSFGEAILHNLPNITGEYKLTQEFMFSDTRTLVIPTLVAIYNGTIEFMSNIYPAEQFEEFLLSDDAELTMMFDN